MYPLLRRYVEGLVLTLEVPGSIQLGRSQGNFRFFKINFLCFHHLEYKVRTVLHWLQAVVYSQGMLVVLWCIHTANLSSTDKKLRGPFISVYRKPSSPLSPLRRLHPPPAPPSVVAVSVEGVPRAH